jgi:hypothetical protein
MKPMLYVMSLGLFSVFVTFIIANHYFEGLINEQSYDRGLKYDAARLKINSGAFALSEIRVAGQGTNFQVRFAIDSKKDREFAIREVKIFRPLEREKKKISQRQIRRQGKNNFSFDLNGGLPGIYIIEALINEGSPDLILSGNFFIK